MDLREWMHYKRNKKKKILTSRRLYKWQTRRINFFLITYLYFYPHYMVFQIHVTNGSQNVYISPFFCILYYSFLKKIMILNKSRFIITGLKKRLERIINILSCHIIFNLKKKRSRLLFDSKSPASFLYKKFFFCLVQIFVFDIFDVFATDDNRIGCNYKLSRFDAARCLAKLPNQSFSVKMYILFVVICTLRRNQFGYLQGISFYVGAVPILLCFIIKASSLILDLVKLSPFNNGLKNGFAMQFQKKQIGEWYDRMVFSVRHCYLRSL